MEEITITKLECANCGHIAVALEGKGTDCIDCVNGKYEIEAGTQDYEVRPFEAQRYRREYPETVE